ncbi:gastrula zinc finger protein XlCGF66.1-like [Anomaloglossus baeobatrachus]|uniref:gastrula zinc finger protein XlCGF66.1-like n=1 Tax=Anomaloglossus baeobatrachus TaxID=238106 RepID=UPI003F50707C
MMTEQILDLTLEIVALLTGEDYTVVKKSDKCVTPDPDHQVSGRGRKKQSPIKKTPPSSLTIPGDNEQKIVEIINKILRVLTGEVPVRCEDVTVYLSVDEWEYIEGHKDHSIRFYS